MNIDERVPEHLRGGLQRYIEQGIKPGDFLTAVLENDLMEAMGRGDLASLAGLFGLCGWLYNEAPAACHGSEAKVRKWIEDTPTREKINQARTATRSSTPDR